MKHELPLLRKEYLADNLNENNIDLNPLIQFETWLRQALDADIIEPNANPCIAKMDEVAQAALKAGISYEDLIQKILDLGLIRHERSTL